MWTVGLWSGAAMMSSDKTAANAAANAASNTGIKKGRTV